MAQVGAVRPRGRQYVVENSRRLKERGLAEITPVTRAMSMWLAETWSDIQVRLRELSAGRRERLNHPVNVHSWYRNLDRPQSPGARGHKRTTLQTYELALHAVEAEAPELPEDVARRVTIAVLRALALAARRDVVCATAAPIAAVSSASAEVPMHPA
jgi:hypothetical protein